jgi:uncharacterized membrane protein
MQIFLPRIALIIFILAGAFRVCFEVFCIWQRDFKFTQFLVETVTIVTAGVPTKQAHVLAVGGGMV